LLSKNLAKVANNLKRDKKYLEFALGLNKYRIFSKQNRLHLEKWANHLISAIRYSPDHKYITELVQHEDQDDSISEGTIVKKLDVTDAIKKGKSYMTIYNSNDNWKIGEKISVFMVDGEVFLRNDKNKVNRDNLGLLPEI
jgi:hypothetical protein